jgi:SAM-dependent methyltransferase
VAVIYEHFHRYLWASQFARQRRVLDLGSGEGFGAAILAEVAADVVGIDIDPTAVEHSQLNYGRVGLAFRVASATDLSTFESDAFDTVVAFEVIEHLSEQEEVITEIRRVLRNDGTLIMSTPDRGAYSESGGNQNPFHVRELSLEEFVSLIRPHFQNVDLFGQALVEGSQINALDLDTSAPIESGTLNFTLARSGEEWRLPPTSPPMYLIAVASSASVQPPRLSTLADPEHTLISDKEREVRADRDNLVGQIQLLKERQRELDSELAAARQRVAEIDNSVTISVIETLKRGFYRFAPRDSRIARIARATLRLIGRAVVRRQT